MTVSVLMLAGSVLFYGLAFLFHLLSFWDVREEGNEEAAWLLRVGFLFGTFYFVLEAVKSRAFLPVISHDQAMAFFGWSIAFVYLVLLARIQSESFGLILNPVLFFLSGFAVLTRIFCKDIHANLKPELMNSYFTLHILCAFFAYASFSISFAAGVLYLIQHRQLKAKQIGRFYHKLPSLESLEHLIHQPLVWGTPLLFLAVLLGFFWARAVYGSWWALDPKTLMTLVIGGVYAGLLFFRRFGIWNGKKIAAASVLIFVLVITSFIGLRFIHGSHNYLKEPAASAKGIK